VKPPVPYSLEVGERICELIAERHLSLLQICGRPENNIPPVELGLPCYRQAHRWRKDHPEFAKAYQEAVEIRTFAQAEEIIAIADEVPDQVTVITEKGDRMTRVDTGFVQHQRNRVFARQWVAARMLPKVFGDRMAHGFLGKDGEAVDPPIISIGFDNGGPGTDPATPADPGSDPESGS
jgi:hypothetical protein